MPWWESNICFCLPRSAKSKGHDGHLWPRQRPDQWPHHKALFAWCYGWWLLIVDCINNNWLTPSDHVNKALYFWLRAYQPQTHTIRTVVKGSNSSFHRVRKIGERLILTDPGSELIVVYLQRGVFITDFDSRPLWRSGLSCSSWRRSLTIGAGASAVPANTLASNNEMTVTPGKSWLR